MAAKRKASSSNSGAEPRSFQVSPPMGPFFSMQTSQQTTYWLILGILVLGLGIWVTYLSMQVQQIYDRIDALNADSSVVTMHHTQKRHY